MSVGESKKLIAIVGIVCLLIGFGIGWFAKPTPPTTTLIVIGPWSGDEMQNFLPVLNAFTEKTGIQVQYKMYRAEDLATILPAQFEAGTAPGDIIFMWAWWIKNNTQHIVDLSDIIKASDYMPGIVDQVSVNGKVYGAPYTGKVKPGFWYRISFFKEHNLQVPTTWDEFVSLLQTIKNIPGIDAPIASGDGVGWPLSDVTEHFILTFGGVNMFKGLINGSISWTSDEVKAIFRDKLVPLLENGYFSEPKDWTLILDDWWNGKYALYFMGSWITGMVDNASDLGVFSLPGAKAFVFAPDFCFIPKYSENVDAAKQLIAFLSGAEGQTIQVKQGGHIATNLGVSLDDYPAVDRKVAELLQGATAVTDLDDTIGGEFQTNFWDQLKYLWVHPTEWETVLANIQSKAPSP
ncbi:MAG: ABC transporter substrate-binding protein [Candidatus Asgardarchaeia archaeon]